MKRLVVALCALTAACHGAVTSNAGPILIATVDTLVDTESALLANAADLDVAPSGAVFAADVQSDRLLRIDPTTGATAALGRPGQGPGELDGPWAVKALDDGVLVVDRGNGRVQRLGPAGEYLASTPVTPMVMRAVPFLAEDGSRSAARFTALRYFRDVVAVGDELWMLLDTPAEAAGVAVIAEAVAGCDGVLTVLVPWGVQQYATGTAQAVLDHTPAGARLVGDPVLASNKTRRVDFAHFMVAALEDDALIGEAPAIVGCRTPSALAHEPDHG
jgi:hypothetical protein